MPDTPPEECVLLSAPWSQVVKARELQRKRYIREGKIKETKYTTKNTMKMKNVHPIYLVGFSLIMFAVAFLDAELHDAASIQQLSWWGKTAVVLFTLPLGYWFFNWLIGWVNRDD